MFSWSVFGDNSDAELLKLSEDANDLKNLMRSLDFVQISDLRKDLIFTDKWRKIIFQTT